MVKILNYAKNINRNVNDNLLINGNFDVWQRGTPFYAGGFTADRWYLVSNGANKASRIAGNIGLDNATNHIRLTTLSSGSYPVLSQAVDSDITSGLRGKQAIFSFYAKKPSDSNWTGLVYGKVYYSTDFDSLVNGKSEIIDSAFSGTLSTDSWTLYSKSFTVPNNASTLMVEISPSGGLNNTSIIDIGRAKLELGSVVTSFKPVTYNEELNRCKRFYQKVEAKLKAGTGAGNSTKKFGVSTPLPVTPRSNTAKITVAQNSNNLIESFTASISNDSYLNVFAESKQPHSELSLEFYIDSEIPYITVPGVINGASFIRGSGKVDIDWNPPTNSDTTISYTTLYGSNPSDLVNIQSFTDSTGTITGLIDSSPYYFKLYSTNSAGDSLLSNLFEVAPAYTVPSGISSLTGIWGFDQTIVNWNPPTNNGGSPITGYRIDRSMYSNFPDTSTNPLYNSTFYSPVPLTTSQTTTSQGLSLYYNGTKLQFNIAKFSNELTSTGNYYFRITPINLAGTGTPSSFTLVKTTPSAPINLSSSVGDGYVIISYLPPTGNGGNTISLVNLERSTTGTFTSNTTSSNHTANYQSITVTGLTNSTTYYFRMRAYNQLGYGSYSSGILAVPNRPITVPNPPSGFNAGWVDDDTVSLSWNPPSDNGGSPIINYTIYASSGSGFTSNLLTLTTQNSISSITFDVPITGNYNTFYFRGKANNSVGSSNNSSSISLNKQVPEITTIHTYSPGDAIVSTAWFKPISKGSAITGYNLQYSTDSTFNTSITNIFTTGLQHTATSLTNNTQYNFRVRAINSVGTGSFSTTVSTTPVSPYSAPTAPSNTLITILQVPASNNFNMLPVNLSTLNNTYVNYNTMYGVSITTPFTGGLIWGVNPYIRQSDTRTSVVHAGALGAAQTGTAYIFVTDGLSQYYPVTRNGITSLLDGSFPLSYEIVGSNVGATCSNFTFGTATGVSTNGYVPRISWTPPTNNGGLPITGYEIQYAADSSFSSQLTTAYTSGNTPFRTRCITHSGVDLYCRVRAYNATGVSPWSSTASYLGKGLSAPLAPLTLGASVIGITGIGISWTPPSGPIGSGFDSPSNIRYRLQLDNPFETTFTDFSGVTSANIRIPRGPGTYSLTMQTRNRAYFSSDSIRTSIVVPPPANIPLSWSFTYGTLSDIFEKRVYPGTSVPSQQSLSDRYTPNGLWHTSAIWDRTDSIYGSYSNTTGNFVMADFGTFRIISNIIVGPISPSYGSYGSWGWQYLNGALLQWSTNLALPWNNIATINTPDFTARALIYSQPYIPANLNVRYIRILMPLRTWLGIGTFNIT